MIVRVPAWSIAHVKPGVKARIKVDGIVDRVLTGTISEVAPLPDPMSYFGGPKVYTTRVRFDDPPAALVIDQRVKVEIDVADFDDVLIVPVQAVLSFERKDHLAVKKSEGGFEWRDVILGAANAHFFEVKTGLKAGEQVIVEPAKLKNKQKQRPELMSAHGNGLSASPIDDPHLYDIKCRGLGSLKCCLSCGFNP